MRNDYTTRNESLGLDKSPYRGPAVGCRKDLEEGKEARRREEGSEGGDGKKGRRRKI